MSLTGLLFDKDGTLFDFQKSWARWAAASLRDLADGDAAHTDRLATAVGFDLAAERFLPESVIIAGTVAETAAVLSPHLPDLSEDAIARRLTSSATQTVMAPAVPLRPLLESLRDRGYRLGVATNDGEASARAHLQHFGILDLFPFLAGYDSGYGAKPDPGMLTAFADHLDADPATLLMIGDSTHDLIAGKAAGFRTLGVLTGVAMAADLEPWADAILPDIGALPDWLRAQREAG